MSYFGTNQGPRRRAGCGGRLLIGILIALFGWIMYMNQIEVNPVTQQKQHVAISPDQEIRLGLESAPQMSKEMGGELPDSDPRTQEVLRIGAYLVSHTVAQNSPWKFQFHLLADSKTVNAFALPGGQIFITLGLLDKLQTEAQLAGVLSHEMGHVIERHTAEQMAKNQLGQSLAIAVGTAASDQSSNAYVIASVVNQVIQLRYSREDESEADIWGVKLLVQAGYNPRAMIEVMKILKAAGDKTSSMEIFQTHPNPDLRISQLEEYLSKNPPDEKLSNGQPLKKAF